MSTSGTQACSQQSGRDGVITSAASMAVSSRVPQGTVSTPKAHAAHLPPATAQSCCQLLQRRPVGDGHGPAAATGQTAEGCWAAAVAAAVAAGRGLLPWCVPESAKRRTAHGFEAQPGRGQPGKLRGRPPLHSPSCRAQPFRRSHWANACRAQQLAEEACGAQGSERRWAAGSQSARAGLPSLNTSACVPPKASCRPGGDKGAGRGPPRNSAR